jgi:Rrf2 family protein
MKLSTKSRYGLRAMLFLAIAHRDGVIMTREIAERQNLPETYLEQLMLSMRKAGLLSSVRGAKGGYMLAQRPEDITLAKIVVALEGSLNVADCADSPNCCLTSEACALKDVFMEVNNALYNTLDGISLSDLAHRQQIRELATTPMYFI